MKEWLQQLGSTLGAALAAACCLGVPVVLSALGALGLSFLIHDALLFPLFVGFVGLSLWLLYRSARKKGRPAPFWLGLAGGVFGAAGLWLLVTGVWPQPWTVYIGVGTLVAGSLWDLVNARRRAACEPEPVCETKSESLPWTPGQRATRGAALSVAAAAAFYGLYQSVEVMVPSAAADEIACWGINQCKGTTACTTAFNACTGQNSCKGKGYIYVPEDECYAQGGQLLENSPGDPTRKD